VTKIERFINKNTYVDTMKISYSDAKEFVKSLEEVLDIIKQRKPTCVIAPMFGAVPFIDILNIIDDDFSKNTNVEYVSASNKIHRLRDVLRGSFENIINAYAPDGGEFLSIDEVISGNSLKRVEKQFDAARMNYANRKTIELYGDKTDFKDENVKSFRDSVVESIKYNSVGIEDSRGEGKKNSEYESLVEKGVVIPVKTKSIVTMDRTDFFPAQYKQDKDSEGNTIFLPVIDKFDISSNYMDFLQTAAGILGKDPERVSLKNVGKIRSSYKWVPEDLRSLT